MTEQERQSYFRGLLKDKPQKEPDWERYRRLKRLAIDADDCYLPPYGHTPPKERGLR